jgi:peptidoglycan hydrolase-like protein with peptidoglycan-binding domain
MESKVPSVIAGCPSISRQWIPSGLQYTERPPSPSFFPSEPEGYISKIGEKSSFVAIVQLMLRELSVIFDTVPELVIDGVFGPQTELAIKEFQKASMLEVTGEIDLQTYNRLNNAFLSVSYFS